MTLAIVWRSNRLSLVDISDMNNIKNLTDGVTLPGNPLCVSVVATSKGWTAYCGQSSGYVSAVAITNTGMTKIRDVQLPGISSDVWLDLSVDNNLVYAVASTGPQRAKMFSLSTSDFDVVEGGHFSNRLCKYLPTRLCKRIKYPPCHLRSHCSDFNMVC
jgi:hypothetical protein